MTDTVGFIQKLPTQLVAAFRATLEEIADSDLLLHVVDITHPSAVEQAQAVRNTLDEIHVKGVPMVTALNKIDLMGNPGSAVEWVDDFERAVPISARTGENVDALLTAIDEELYERMVRVSLRIPYAEGSLINLFHEVGSVEGLTHTAEGVELQGHLPRWAVGKFACFEVDLVASVEEPASNPGKRE
jgi:GTP-binding protein HflX